MSSLIRPPRYHAADRTVDPTGGTLAIRDDDTVLALSPTSAYTISSLIGGQPGQRITIGVLAAGATIAGALTCTGRAIPLIAGDRISFFNHGGTWYQCAGNVGMGMFKPNDELIPITTWPTAGITSFTDVDVSSSVRKGAQSAMILTRAYSTSSYGYIYARKNGSAAPKGYTTLVSMVSDKHFHIATRYVMLDDGAIFEACHSSLTEVHAYIVGYTI